MLPYDPENVMKLMSGDYFLKCGMRKGYILTEACSARGMWPPLVEA